MGRMLRVGSLFAGIGGLELGLEMTGHFKTVWQVEKDEYATRVLAKHWPDVKRHDDVCTFPTENQDWSCDVITGGFPCQDLSYAGHGAGLDGKRSGLFYEMSRIVREVAPAYVILENVAALLTRGMGDVLGTMAALGYDCEWHCIPAAAVGAPHIRDRVFILAYRNRARSKERLASKARQNAWITKKPIDCDHGKSWTADKHKVDWWAVEPKLDRLVYGVSSRVDRLRCLGNAVVPQVAHVVGQILWEVHCGQDEQKQREARRA